MGRGRLRERGGGEGRERRGEVVRTEGEGGWERGGGWGGEGGEGVGEVNRQGGWRQEEEQVGAGEDERVVVFF